MKFSLSRLGRSKAWITVLTGILTAHAEVTVNSLLDPPTPGPGEMTLRAALETAGDGEPIVFAPELDGGTIELTQVGEEHSTLIGEVMGFDYENNISYLVGYFERDYGSSALYSTNDVVIDASALSNGITIAWAEANTNAARVLAVYGNLSMTNVSVTGGHSVSHTNVVSVGGHDQYTTRGRGGGIAVWGVATLDRCRIYNNSCSAEAMDPGRDAGLFGGGVYANIVQMTDSIVSGNAVTAVGVSGGGVFSVGGADDAPETESYIERSTLSGNLLTGIFAYGAGVYSDGGGIGTSKTLRLRNCTIAENRVDLLYSAPFLFGSGYWRGGGVYMSNGDLEIRNCTIVNNHVTGVPRELELGKANLAGGVAATIGNAHAAEAMTIGQSIITGNTVQEYGGDLYQQDIFSGSLFEFISEGYNRIGIIDFSQILVPVEGINWFSMCRKHYPKNGDLEGVALSDAVDLAYGVTRSTHILSKGVNAGQPAVLAYSPWLSAIDQAPASTYGNTIILAEYWAWGNVTNNFRNIILGRIESTYGLPGFTTNFTAGFEAFLAEVDVDAETPGNQPYTDPDDNPILTLEDAEWFGPENTWPAQQENYPYIEFWHRLDTALEEAGIPGMGSELLGDEAWATLFPYVDDDPKKLAEDDNSWFDIWTGYRDLTPPALDQTGAPRPANGLTDIGAVEMHPAEPPIVRWETPAGSGPDFVLRWNSYPESTYTVWGASNLASNDWIKVAEQLTNTLPFNVYTGQADHATRFFKIEKE